MAPGLQRRTVADAPVAHGEVLQQVRRDWAFAGDGVRFDNRLPGARLQAVERLGEGRYLLTIQPETRPVNPSPWYGFRVRAQSPRRLALTLRFPEYTHRYTPKLGTEDKDGLHWRTIDDSAHVRHADGTARLDVDVGRQPLRVFAQPPLDAADFTLWTKQLGQHVELRRMTFGRSVQGRPLHAFSFGGSDDSPVVFVLGRQHPPENTGSQALLRFIETLAADTPAAHAYRAQVRTVVIPLLNPDGVIEGHWRGNAHGVDLNRDWGPFAEPETRAARDLLLAAAGQGTRQVRFAIDFHSTHSDRLYTVRDDPSLAPGGLMRAWIDRLHASFPGRIRESAYAADSAVFKNWAYCSLGAPSVTYEVGDDTPPDTLDALAGAAAEALMTELASRPPSSPSWRPVCPPPATQATAGLFR